MSEWGYVDTPLGWQLAQGLKQVADHEVRLKRLEEAVVDEKLVKRMEALVRRLENGFGAIPNLAGRITDQEAVAEARAIVAELPEPVDPLLLEAREMAAAALGEELGTKSYGETMAGDWDHISLVKVALTALRRGIEIGKGEG